MLVVRIELWPHGDESKKQEIAVGSVVNNGTGDPESGNYDAEFVGVPFGRYERRATKVWAFPRLKLGPWDLLYRALRAAVGGRNP